jgi:hypothetical protein
MKKKIVFYPEACKAGHKDLRLHRLGKD